jgi:predicted nucleotide-binding protein
MIFMKLDHPRPSKNSWCSVNSIIEKIGVEDRHFARSTVQSLMDDGLVNYQKGEEYLDGQFEIIAQINTNGQKFLIDLETTPGTNSVKEKDKSDTKSVMLNKKIFIVHGHDELAKVNLARFIENLGLTPIILHEQASASQTIIEKIESYSDVGFAIILYTPCDHGSKNDHSESLNLRARQNVVFEHGYFIGRLSRLRVVALVKNEVETPKDISGIVYIDFDRRGAWKMDLSKELKEAGYEIDINQVI